MRELRIGECVISDCAPCFVCAEIGHNHGGDVEVAKRMIDAAALAGASAVKFQKRDNATLYASSLLEKPYGGENSYGATYGEHRQALEFSHEDFKRIDAYCASRGVTWFATAFDEASVDFLMQFSVPAFKVHSGGLTDKPLLQHLAQTGKPVILSTGAGTLADIDDAHAIFWNRPHAFLHCTAEYPLKAEDANLRAIMTLRERYPNTVIGFSTHFPGLSLSLVAYGLGARVLEHHFTLNRASKGTDHAFSLEPKGLQTLVEDLETCRKALGTGQKIILPSETGAISKMRRSQTPEGWRIAG